MLFALATLPPIVVIFIIYKLDKYEKEPIKQIVRVFLYGCLTVIPVILIANIRDPLYKSGYLENLVNLTGGGILGISEMSIFLYAVIGVALVEEYFKFLVLTKYIYNTPDFNEPMDGIVYGVTASMGFAFIENLMYVYFYVKPEEAFLTAVVRICSAIPAHALMGVIMGYYVGKAKFSINNEKRLLLKGLLGAIILHGIYDYFLLSQNGLAIFACASLIISVIIAKKAIKENVENSPFK
jgi:RsiW-degrading membrane proteinase PrsW (M82 family)